MILFSVAIDQNTNEVVVGGNISVADILPALQQIAIAQGIADAQNAIVAKEA